MRDFIRDVRFFLHNLIYWLPILWQDRDWDYQFLLDILVHKLNGMSKHIRENGNLVRSEEIADEIGEIAYNIQLVGEDIIVTGAVRAHKSKWGETAWDLIPAGDKDFFQIRMSYPSADTPAKLEQANAELEKLMNEAEKEQEKLLRDTFSRMAEQLLGWWD